MRAFPRILPRALALALTPALFALPSRLRADAAASGWAQVPRILARIHAPEFPDRTFPITRFGAVAGGADCTGAIRRAIEACHAAGGGHVVVPAGVFRTGGIRLLSGVDLHLDAGATLRFSTDPAAYLPVVLSRWEGIECMNYQALIYAQGQENIAVTGTGTLDGGASLANWWAWTRRRGGQPAPATADSRALNQMGDRGVPVAQRVFGAGHYLRPNFFQPFDCRNVLISGVTIVRSPMWEINPELCTNVTVRDVKISSLGPNNDGCDPESSRDVLIEGCVFNTGDDCIAIKSGRNADGRRVGVPAEDLIVRDCQMRDGHAGVAIGSEVSGSCRNVFVEDCTMDSPHLDRVLRLKSNAERGGVIENVYLRHLKVGRVAEALVTVDFLYEEGPNGPFPPVVRNIFIDHVTADGCPRIFFITGFAGATIDNIQVADSTIEGVSAPEVIEHAGRIVLDHVRVAPARAVHSLNSRLGD
jgi:polygalacturonase